MNNSKMFKSVRKVGKNIFFLMMVFSQLGWATGNASAQVNGSPVIHMPRNEYCPISAVCSVTSIGESIAVISPPANVQASDGTYTTKVQVSWDVSSGATFYNIYSSTSEDGTKTLLGSPSVTSFDDTSATPGVYYFYWVNAQNSTDQSGFSVYDTGWRTDSHDVSGWTGVVVPSVPADLVAACHAEGVITIMATPDDWANYGQILADFIATTGAAINSINPFAGSADELAAIEDNKDNKGPLAPDIVDVGYGFGAQGIAAGDFLAYKVSSWDRIPTTLLDVPAKDPDGYWTGGYYGAITMEINSEVVSIPPSNWSDLLNPTYHNQVALSGDPRSSNQAIQAVYAAALGNGGSLDNAQAGLDFFKDLNDIGNFAGVNGNATNIRNGTTPIVLAWDYLALSDRDAFDLHPPITVQYPSPTIASMYIQAISKFAPHFNCAKAWMEIIQADEGQLAWMVGYAHGVDQANMDARGVIPQWLKDRLPDFSAYASAVSPTPNQLAAAKALITANWLKTEFKIFLPFIRR